MYALHAKTLGSISNTNLGTITVFLTVIQTCFFFYPWGTDQSIPRGTQSVLMPGETLEVVSAAQDQSTTSYMQGCKKSTLASVLSEPPKIYAILITV